MKPFDRHELSALMATHEAPCVTLMMPLHGRPPGSQQDPILFANLVRQVREALDARAGGKRDEAIAAMLENLQGLGNGAEETGATSGSFWNRHGRGLAVFISPNHFAHYQVSLSLPETTLVGDSFHVKPMLPLLHDDVRFHVLAISRDEVRLYEGDGEHISEIRVDGLPRNMKEAIGTEFDDSKLGRSFHGSPDHHKGRGSGASGIHFHGYGGSDKHVEADMMHFFREVDRIVTDRVSQPTGRPLILCALDSHHPTFRQLSRNPHLLPEGLKHSPKDTTPEEMRAEAWDIFAPLRANRIAQALDAYGAASGRGRAFSDLADVARAAVAGRVGRLLIEDGREVWGRLDRAVGSVSFADAGGEGVQDLLDELAEVVLAFGGDVLLVPKAKMPVTTGVAATCRF